MILVTGGTGLVGSHLLLRLAKSGKKLRAIKRGNSKLEPVKQVFSYEHSPEEVQQLFQSIEWVDADILDIPALEEAFKEVTTVYHCAAIVSFSPADNKHLRQTNIEGTANIVNLCIKNQVNKLCYVSSIATLDQKLGETEISETSSWNKELDHSMYSITKYGAEMEVWRASQEGVPVIIVNPGVIFGPGFWDSGTGQLFPRVNKGLRYYLPKTTGFVGVHDVAKAMHLLMDSNLENEKFVLVSENLSTRDILEFIAGSLGKPAPSKSIKPWMISLSYIVEKVFSLFGRRRQLTRQSSKTLFSSSRYSSNKISSMLDFQFQPMQEVISESGRRYLHETKR